MIFSSPIKIFIGSQSEPLLFQSSDEFVEWVEAQVTEWNDFSVRVKPVSDVVPKASAYIVQNSSNWLNHQNSLKRYVVANDEASIGNVVHDLQNEMQQGQTIWSGEVIASKAIAASEVDQISAVWLFLLASGYSGNVLLNYGTTQNWANFAKSLLLIVDSRSTASFHNKQRAAIRSVEKAISASNSKLHSITDSEVNLKAEFEALGEKVKFDFDALRAEFYTEANSQRNGFDGEWNKLKAAYDTQLKLQAPRDYWQKKLEVHTVSAKNWRSAFFGMIVISLILLATGVCSLGLQWIVIPTVLGGYSWIIPAVLIGIPAFLSLWLLRFFGRQWSEHLTRMEDARERVVMIDTFLALSRDMDSPSAITDPAQLALVLSAIFRPASGGGNDDSPPAGFFEAILTKISKS